MPRQRTRGAAPRTRGPVAPVTVRKVHYGVHDLAAALRRDAIQRVGEHGLHRIRVIHPGAYELDLTDTLHTR